MAISLEGTFEYEISNLTRTESEGAFWTGQTRTLRRLPMHPGLVGARPDFKLTGGEIALYHSEPKKVEYFKKVKERLKKQDLQRWKSFPGYPIKVGTALETVVQEGDRLYLYRSQTGDIGISLLRKEKLVLAMGNIIGMPLSNGIKAKAQLELGDGKTDLERFLNPPKVSRVIITADEETFALSKGEYKNTRSYFFHLLRPNIPGIPGWAAMLSIAQLSANLSAEIMIASTTILTKEGLYFFRTTQSDML